MPGETPDFFLTAKASRPTPTLVAITTPQTKTATPSTFYELGVVFGVEYFSHWLDDSFNQ